MLIRLDPDLRSHCRPSRRERRVARRVLGVLLLAAAWGCSDRSLALTAPEDPRVALAKASVAKAQELFTLALRADSAGQLYRPLLLRALVDGLQFGAPIQNIPIRIGPDNLTFNVIAQDAVMTSGGSVSSSGGMLLAWRGINADQILVILAPYGPGVDPAAFNTVAFYLEGDDTPRIATSGSATASFDPPGASCAYQATTPLLGPPGVCQDERMATALSLTLYPNGDTSAPAQTVQLSRTNVSGQRVTRRVEDFPALAMTRLLQSR